MLRAGATLGAEASAPLADSLTAPPLEPAAPPPPPPPSSLPAITVTGNGVQSLLQPLPHESAADAARRWLAGSVFAAEADSDAILRLLEHMLRREAGAGDGLPVTTEGGRRTLGSVRVRLPVPGGGEGALSAPRIARWLAGESAREAAVGFVERAGLPAQPNAALLEAELSAAGAAGLQAEGGEAPAGGVRAEGGGGGGAAAGEPPAPLVPAAQGFSLRVSFREAERAPAHIVYRFGEDVHSAVAAFLDEHRVTDAGAREEATRALTAALSARASEALAGGQVALGAGGAAAAAAASGDARDIVARAAFVLPLAVGGAGFDVSVPAGTSLWAAARVFCEQHWDVLAPAMSGAVERLFAGSGSGGAAAAGEAGGGGAGEGGGGEAAAAAAAAAAPGQQRSVVSLDTCRAVVFDLMADFAQGGGAGAG